MKKFLLLSVGLLGLSGCVTTSGPDTQVTQSAITNAAMLGEGADCSSLANGITEMDQIILAAAEVQGKSYGNSDTFAGTKQTLMGKIYQSQAMRENAGIATDIMRSFSGSNANSAANLNVLRQQSASAQKEKNRLIGVFQKKGCSA